MFIKIKDGIKHTRSNRLMPALQIDFNKSSALSGFKINNRELIKLYQEKNYDELSQKFLEIIEFYKNNIYKDLNNKEQYSIDYFLNTFLYIFTQEDYIISSNYTHLFLQNCFVISSIVAVSSFKTTDPWISMLMMQENNFVKLLTLYSFRNNIKLNIDGLFELEPYLTSMWYFNNFWVCPFTQTTFNNTVKYLNNINDKLALYPSLLHSNFHGSYYTSTYYGNDSKIRKKINELVKDKVKDIKIVNKPDKKKIAIVSGKCIKGNAVYKVCYDFISSLKEHYELTLIHLGDLTPDIDVEFFDDVKVAKVENDTINIDQIKENNFALAYFMEIGTTKESIVLSNLKIAPIQISGYGHPVSTFGSEVNYFIGGSDIEIIEKSEENFSERLVLIEGLGVNSVYPDYEIQNIKNTSEKLIINCPLIMLKRNYNLLYALRHILQRSNKKVFFRFFGLSKQLAIFNHQCEFIKEASDILGRENFEALPNLDYKSYMKYMEEGDLTLDSYPYGGCNTIFDSLYLKKPVIVIEGNNFYNRAAAQILRRIGLSPLIADDWESYASIILAFIKDDAFRAKISDKLKKADLKTSILDADGPANFKKAIDYLINNHEKLEKEESKEPIFIE